MPQKRECGIHALGSLPRLLFGTECFSILIVTIAPTVPRMHVLQCPVMIAATAVNICIPYAFDFALPRHMLVGNHNFLDILAEEFLPPIS